MRIWLFGRNYRTHVSGDVGIAWKCDVWHYCAMYIEAVPNRNSPPAILLRESYRDGGKIKKRTLLNLSDWPTELVEGLRAPAEGRHGRRRRARKPSPSRRSLPHGHVAAALGTLRDIGLDRLLGPAAQPLPRSRPRHDRRPAHRAGLQARDRPRARPGAPPPRASATCSASARSTRTSSTPRSTGWASASRRSRRRSPGAICTDGTLVLYDVSSSYLEGRCCPLAQAAATAATARRASCRSSTACCAPPTAARSRSRCSRATPPTRRTLAAQIDKLKQRFALDARRAGRRPRHDHAGAHRREICSRPGSTGSPRCARRRSGRWSRAAHLQMSLFDERDMAAITSPDYPGERLIVCRNPDLAARARPQARGPARRHRARPRRHRRRASRASASRCAARPRSASRSAPCSTSTRWPSTSTSPSRDDELHLRAARPTQIAAEAALDGLYVVRTSLPAEALDDAATVRAYKSLAQVERAFRSLKTVDLHVRPIYHWRRRACAPTSFCACSPIMSNGTCAPGSRRCSTTTTDQEAAAALRASHRRQGRALRRPLGASRPPAAPPTASRCTASSSLLADLATYRRLQASTALQRKVRLHAPHQANPRSSTRAFELLAVNPDRTQ